MTFRNKIQARIVDKLSGGMETKEIGQHLASLVSEDRDYALKHLPKHMVDAGRFEQLYQWLMDFDWIEAKVGHPEIKIQKLIEDYELALNADVVLSGEQQRVLRLIQGALRLSAHVLDKDTTQLVEQLLGRLGYFDLPEIQKILEVAKQRKNAPWLRPLKPNLTPPGGALIRTLAGHSGSVNAVAVTPDGQKAISASYDKTLKVWDLVSGEELLTFSGYSDSYHPGRVIQPAMAIAPDGQKAIYNSYDNTFKVWDLVSGEELLTFTDRGDFASTVTVTPDGQKLISAYSDGTLKSWDLVSGEELLTLTGHSSWVGAVAVTPDGQKLIAGSVDGTLKVWDLVSGKELLTLTGHSSWVNAVEIAPDGQKLISASSDNTLKVWDLATGELIATFTGDGGINGCWSAPDGATFFASDALGRLHFLRLEGVREFDPP